jgi:hypothetical protein
MYKKFRMAMLALGLLVATLAPTLATGAVGTEYPACEPVRCS